MLTWLDVAHVALEISITVALLAGLLIAAAGVLATYGGIIVWGCPC